MSGLEGRDLKKREMQGVHECKSLSEFRTTVVEPSCGGWPVAWVIDRRKETKCVVPRANSRATVFVPRNSIPASPVFYVVEWIDAHNEGRVWGWIDATKIPSRETRFYPIDFIDTSPPPRPQRLPPRPVVHVDEAEAKRTAQARQVGEWVGFGAGDAFPYRVWSDSRVAPRAVPRKVEEARERHAAVQGLKQMIRGGCTPEVRARTCFQLEVCRSVAADPKTDRVLRRLCVSVINKIEN